MTLSTKIKKLERQAEIVTDNLLAEISRVRDAIGEASDAEALSRKLEFKKLCTQAAMRLQVILSMYTSAFDERGLPNPEFVKRALQLIQSFRKAADEISETKIDDRRIFT